MQQLIEAQRSYFLTHETKDVSFRIKQLKKLDRIIRANEQLLLDAIYKDFKKSAFDTITNELELVYHDIREAIHNVRKWAEMERVGTNWVNWPARSFIKPEPLGVTLVIGAWNYPLQLSFAPVVASMAAGNTIILKPSELPKHSSAAMTKIINENFDPSYFLVVEGGVPETTELLENKFDKIFFTGSTPVGKIIYQAAAKHLTPVTLELGGKSPAIVSDKCNMKMTIKRLIWAKFLNSGQTCIAPDYILVQRSIYDEFLERAVEEIKRSNLAVENDNFIQILDHRNLDRLEKLLDPDKVHFGGKVSREERTLEPTIMTNVGTDDPVMQEEIFGPIMPVIPYDTIEDAIAYVHQFEKPLACYLFSKSKKEQQKVLNEVSFGGGSINEAVMHITNSSIGFGGVGNSGMGSYHGHFGFRSFSHYKGVMKKPNWFETGIKYGKHTNFKLKLARFIFRQG